MIKRETRNKKQEGFIALMSAVVISILVLAITLSLGMSGFFGRFNVLDSEFKERTFALAEACGDVAILKLAQDASYNPSNEVVNVGSDSCTIVSLTTSGSNKIIKTQAIINKAYTNLKITVNAFTFVVAAEDECMILSSC